MEKIKSFTIDHDKHNPGFYLSGENKGIYTYDLRFKWPNRNDYLSTASAHSIEHLFATVARNSKIADKVIYFGPMGCRTGFYLLINGIEPKEAFEFTLDCIKICIQQKEVPGSEKADCGNYLDHSLNAAKTDLEEYLQILIKQTEIYKYKVNENQK